MPDISETDEQRLIDAVKAAVDLAEQGLSPDAAVEKVARAEQFGPGQIRLLGYAYNTGRQTSQWQDGGNILDKLATFPLVDPQAVVDRIYGNTKEAADHDGTDVSSDYRRPPAWLAARARGETLSLIKTAQDRATTREAPPVGQEPLAKLEKAAAARQRNKQARDEAVRLRSEAEDRLRGGVAELVTYFKQASCDRLPFAVVESAAAVYFGGAAEPLLDTVYRESRLREKRASACAISSALDLQAPPFTAITACFTAAANVQEARSREKAAAEVTSGDAFFSRQPVAAPQPADKAALLFDDTEKAAGILGTPAVGAFVGSLLSRGIGQMPQTKEDMVENTWMDLEDPAHANEMRKIKTHAMLNSMLTDPDDPISGYDHDKVLQAFNEISQVAPRLAENAASLRPVLRRRLQSHSEPFETKELADTEKSIAGTRMPTPNTSILGETPDKLLG